jgi:hypothetical protein
MTVIDMGSVARPLPKEDYLRIKQFFLSLYLSAGTADSHYLQLFYQNHIKNPQEDQPEIDIIKLKQLFVDIQKKLDAIKKTSQDHNVINADTVSAEIISMLENAVFNLGTGIIPKGLHDLSRSNALIAKELEHLIRDLEGSPFVNEIPYAERTHFAITFKAFWKNRKNNPSALWTQEMRDYFIYSMMHGNKDQLRFSKKFIYGIFGLTDDEATLADKIIPSAIISGFTASILGGIYIGKGINTAWTKLPQLIDSYRFLERVKEFKHDFMIQNPYLNHTSNELILFKKSVRQTFERNANHFQTIYRQANKYPFFKRFVPGLIIGGAITYSAQKIYDYRINKPK